MQDVRIKRLRLHANGGNHVAARLALQQTLRQTPLQPSFLPSGAVLVIRRLDQLPPFARAGSASQEWAHQVQKRIDELARHAVRPAHQYVRVDAESVLFSDGVELLVCCTRDCLAGHSSWYWDSLFPTLPNAPVDERLVMAWSQHVEALPRTLARLSPAEAVQAVRRLDRRGLAQLAHQLQATFDLPLVPVREEAMRTPVHANGLEPANAADDPVPPWTEWLPASVARTLPIEAELFLGVNYLLAMSPQAVRGVDFVPQTVRWFAATAARGRFEQRPKPATAALDNTSDVEHAADATQGLGASSQISAKHSVDTIPGAEVLESGAPDWAASEVAARPHGDADAESPAAQSTATRLGGAFYLINLLTRLGLPWSVNEVATVNTWDFLAALTAALLGERFAEYQADPFWALVAELGGHDLDTPWGTDLPQTSRFALRPEWLAVHGFDTIACHPETTDGRTRLWAADFGWLIADLPGSVEHQDAWEAECRDAGVRPTYIHGPPPPSETLHPAWTARVGPGLGWWLQRCLPYLRFALARLLGAAPVLDFAAPILSLATVRTSATHLDIHFALAQIDLDVRRAGLDQDPGWAPYFGHIVTFYFS